MHPSRTGADAIVPVEDTTVDGATVSISRARSAGEYVREAGSDLAAGATLLPAGTRLASRHIAALAAAGLAEVDVRTRVKIAVISTGSELVAPGGELGPGQIPDANGAALGAAVQAVGADFAMQGRVFDEPATLAAVLDQAIAEGVELVLTSGGISMGDHEVVRELLEPLGAHVDVLAMQPGGPQALATYRGIPVVCFPGNPVSSQLSFELFVAPMLRELAGLPAPRRATLALDAAVTLDSGAAAVPARAATRRRSGGDRLRTGVASGRRAGGIRPHHRDPRGRRRPRGGRFRGNLGAMTELSHLDGEGRARMIDVGAKPVTRRVAVAGGRLDTTAEVIGLVRADGLPKADVLATARIAGIAGAKRTSELIPLAHLLPLDSVTIEFELDETSIAITATVAVTAKTGVEMEALTAVAIAGLTLHDMIKAVDPAATLGDDPPAREVGRQARALDPRGETADAAGDAATVAARGAAIVIVSSTRVAAGSAEDRTGPLIVEWLRARGYDDRRPGDLPRRRHRDGDPGCGGRRARADPDDRRHRHPSRRPHPGGDARRHRSRAARRRRGDARGGLRRRADRRPHPRGRRRRRHRPSS